MSIQSSSSILTTTYLWNNLTQRNQMGIYIDNHCHSSVGMFHHCGTVDLHMDQCLKEHGKCITNWIKLTYYYVLHNGFQCILADNSRENLHQHWGHKSHHSNMDFVHTHHLKHLIQSSISAHEPKWTCFLRTIFTLKSCITIQTCTQVTCSCRSTMSIILTWIRFTIIDSYEKNVWLVEQENARASRAQTRFTAYALKTDSTLTHETARPCYLTSASVSTRILRTNICWW